MEVKKPHIKSIPYEEWNDNASLEKIIDELHEGGVNVITGSLDQLINWGRSNSLWSLTFATSCCGIEFMACGCARYDFARFGFEVTRNSPRQADLIMCAGTITHKMAPALKRLYDEMAEPKYVIAVGGCAISGGPFKSSYHVVKGIEEIVPVDVFIPGCPPRPEAIMYGMMQLQRKVKIEKFFGGMKLEFLSFDFDKFAQEMQNLKDKKGFDYLVTIVGEDFGKEEGLGCVYILENTKTHERCSVKMIAKSQVCGDGMSSNGTSAMEGQMVAYLPTVSNIWKVADLLEREVYDFYGIVFLGHPDMRRLFLRSDFKGHPFRKDWQFDDKYTLEDDVEPDYGLEFYLDKDGNLQSKQNRLFGSDDYVINIGPQHPATHGVLRLQTVLDGETVKRIYPHLGYIHRAIEKMWEGMTYPQTLALTDRLNYLGAMQHRHALVGVIEEALEVELTDRIKYIRTIMDELQRLDSHLLYTSCVAQDLGALTGMLYGMRDREHVLNVMEETTGGRLIQNYYRIGGLQDDIDPNFVKNCKDLVKYLRPTIQEYMDIFGDNIITHNRLENCGPMSLEDCINYAVTGPAGRASGWKNDVRKNHPYDMYDKVEWEQCTLTGCDSMDRYLVHINEMYQSLNIIEQLVAGEFGVYLDSRGDKSPYRMKMRPMGLSLVGAFDPMLRGQKVADLIATCAAIDVVIPDIDR